MILEERILLTVNAIIAWEYETNITYERILWMDYLNDIVFVINVNDNNLPIRRKISEIEEQLKSNNVFIENNDPFFRIQEEEKLTDKDIYMREEAWNYLKDIIKSEPDIYQSKLRSKLISEIAHKKNTHRNSIVKYLKRYWKRGMCKNALLPDYSMCGGAGKERSADKLKRGRPRIYVSLHCETVEITLDKERGLPPVEEIWSTFEKPSHGSLALRVLENRLVRCIGEDL